jgi:3-phosphoshikimate 1-carboxyvinyltransferase
MIDMELISSRGNSLHGQVLLPGDKSLSHRAALLAALAVGESRIENFLASGVTQAMLRALTALGVIWELSGTTLTIEGKGFNGLHPPSAPIDCGNSATTLRLLAGALSASGTQAVLTGSPGLCRRPMERIVTPLRLMGAPIRATTSTTLPLTQTAPLELAARPSDWLLHSIQHSMSVASAQVKSCLLLAGLAADGPTVIDEPEPSRDHTERMLRSMGVMVESQQVTVIEHPIYRVVLNPAQPCSLIPLHIRLPGDFSSAAFLIAAALIVPGSEVTLRGVGLNLLRTGLLDALRHMGADIQVKVEEERGGEPTGELVIRHGPLRGIQVTGDLVVRMIDEFPIFAVVAACAEGTTVVKDATELRHKESDRISTLCVELGLLGVNILESVDGFIVQGGAPLIGGRVNPHGDHRLAMSLAVAGLVAQEPVCVSDAGIINESFPGFITTLQSLGAAQIATTG